MVDLEGLLERFAPKRLLAMEFEVDAAYKDFPLDEAMVSSFPEFEELLGRYHQHLERAVHHCNVAHDKEDSKAFAMGLAERALEGGRVEAFDRARTGCDGGLLAVLRKVGEAFKKQVFEAWLKEALRRTIDMQDWGARERLMAAYVKKYRHLLPSGMSSASPKILATRIEEVFKAHIHAQPLLQRLPQQK